MKKKRLFDDPALNQRTDLSSRMWREIYSHTENEIKGFFGDYRFLNNFWPADVTLEGRDFLAVENAYQSAKFPKGLRKPFCRCTPRNSIILAEDLAGKIPTKKWNRRKVHVMRGLLIQKFDPTRNPENSRMLLETGERYLEETNYWNDVFWGVHKTSALEQGVGENRLGLLLMEIRADLRR